MKRLINIHRDSAGRIISYYKAEGASYAQILKKLYQYEECGKNPAAVKKIIAEKI